MARSDFRIVGDKPIGHGQFGTVFRATRESDGCPVALKIVLRKSVGGADWIEAERQGAALQQRFAELHGMVPAVFDFGDDGDDFYLAMEFVDGPSLDELLRRGPLAPDEAVGHTLWLCEFLDKAHGFTRDVEHEPDQLLHNDLKPAHVMISSAGERRVLDFGISRALQQQKRELTDVARTIAYAAPERLLSGRANAYTDFWSLGVMLYEMVSGHRPYPQFEGHAGRRELYNAIVTNAPRTPLPRGCPPALAAIVNRLLAFQPEHRYQTAAAIREDLERFLRGETPDAGSFYDTPATTPVSRPPASEAPAADAPTAVPVTVVPTDPVPPARAAAVGVIDAAAAPPRTAVVRRTVLSRIAWTVFAMVLVAIVATEGVACIFAERLRSSIGTIDERTVNARREAYEGVDQWSLFDIGLRARVNPLLAPTLRGVGDRVVADYRRERPLMGPAEWRQAAEALRWARELTLGDRMLRAKQLVAEGHVKRFEARTAGSAAAAALANNAALAKFREAADEDERSFDPYLGMAVLQVYALGDVEAAAASIDEAVQRGYKQTRRETALLGDGHMSRARASRNRALLLDGEQRRNELIRAQADFERCVALFEQIIDFGKARHNRDVCRAQVRSIERQLFVPSLPTW